MSSPEAAARAVLPHAQVPSTLVCEDVETVSALALAVVVTEVGSDRSKGEQRCN